MFYIYINIVVCLVCGVLKCDFYKFCNSNLFIYDNKVFFVVVSEMYFVYILIYCLNL